MVEMLLNFVQWDFKFGCERCETDLAKKIEKHQLLVKIDSKGFKLNENNNVKCQFKCKFLN